MFMLLMLGLDKFGGFPVVLDSFNQFCDITRLLRFGDSISGNRAPYNVTLSNAISRLKFTKSKLMVTELWWSGLLFFRFFQITSGTVSKLFSPANYMWN